MTENIEEIENKEKRAKRSRAKTVKAAVAVALLLIANAVFFLMFWILDRYDDVKFDQILYQIKSPIKGTGSGLVIDALLKIGLTGVLLTALEVFIYLLLAGKFKEKLQKFKRYVAYSATRVASFFKKAFLPISCVALICSMLLFILRFDIHSYVINMHTNSEFIEENYIDPDDVDITFPKKKRNLIYIFLESMEFTFSNTDVGGNITDNFIKELTDLADGNVSFTNSSGGGAYQYIGTGWTAAAMVTQTSGVIVKVPSGFENFSTRYLPGITTLGDILKDAGYNQTLLLGSDASFAARDVYFTEHGGYNIIDLYSIIEQGKLPEGYFQWWGYEDVKLFDYAKEELTRLASLDKPFNFTTLTADTHFPDGYTCTICGSEYSEQYANVISCSSKQVYEFISWITEQPFYENTTIVLAGDHLTMDPDFLKGIDEGYVRTTYNCIINSAVKPVKKTDREFGTFDMFPTTLAALGVKIDGNRLGLGTNLFSSIQTLTEKYGFDTVEAELEKNSEFYMNTFYYYEEKDTEENTEE